MKKYTLLKWHVSERRKYTKPPFFAASKLYKEPKPLLKQRCLQSYRIEKIATPIELGGRQFCNLVFSFIQVMNTITSKNQISFSA